jgi:hypothetical protein
MKKSRFKQTTQSKLEKRFTSLNNSLSSGLRIKKSRKFGTGGRYEHIVLANSTMTIKKEIELVRKALQNPYIHVSKHGAIKSLIYREMLVKSGKSPEKVMAMEQQYDAYYGHLEPQGTRYGKFPIRQRITGNA